MKVNLHTHTSYCDGKNSPEEMILDAISAGFDVLGFSGHSYTSFDESYCMSREQTAEYVSEVRALAEKYRDRITVFCGIEQDLFADDPAEGFDYAIGSVHAIFKECDTSSLAQPAAAGQIPEGIHVADGGCYVYVDWQAETLEWAAANLYGGDALSLAEDYFAAVAQLADEPDVQIVGHFDLLTKFEEQLAAEGRRPLFDTEDLRYLKAAGRAIKTLAASDVHSGTDTPLGTGKIFEINTGAMAKGYRTSPYPSLPLLREIRKAGGRIIINSDCHAAGRLDFGFGQAAELARQAGFTHQTLLAPDGRWTEVAL